MDHIISDNWRWLTLPPTGLRIFLKHPSFWPGFRHEQGDFGFNFDFKSVNGQSVPFETTQLNVTEGDEFIFDYQNVNTDNPPTFESYAFEIYDWKEWARYGTTNWHYPFVAGIIYLITIFGIERWMRNRSAYQLKWPLFLWNAALGTFSIIGFIRTAPEFFFILGGQNGFYKAICYRSGGNYPAGFWSLLFVLSKYAELFDTVFIVLRKRPLVFIQWFHHLTTVALAWLSSPYIEPISRWYVVMNYFVHGMMYPYFALAVLGIKLPRKVSITITTCQLTQMLIGLAVNFSSAFLIRIGVPCYRHPFSIKMSFIVYGSFTFLFTKLFYDVITSEKLKKKEKLP